MSPSSEAVLTPFDTEEQLPWEGEGRAIERLRRELEEGADWYPAVLRAIGRWDRPSDVFDSRRYTILIAGEAFDWLALVERFYAELGDLLPADEIERLLFFGQPPDGFDEGQFRDAVGSSKYRTYLNYYYGIVVEEALNRSVEEDILKERSASPFQASRRLTEDVVERIYGAPYGNLLDQFRAERGLPESETIAFSDWKSFTYWRFKYRLRTNHKVKVAADTKRGLDTLERLQRTALSGRKPPPPAPEDDTIDLAPWRFRIVD